jgi:RNA polymerase sigma-70 factor (ECF subfamily)
VSEVIRGSADEELLPLLAAGDADAFAVLYDRHVGRVYAHCARQLGTVQDADDLTAVVFLEMWRHRGGIRSVSGSALPWLLMTATNVSRNHRRSLRRYRAALHRIPPPVPEPDLATEVAHRQALAPAAQALARALRTLRPLDQQVIVLCLLHRLTYAETATVLDLSQAAVRSRLMRARRAIRTSLLEAGITEEEDWT